MAKHITITNIVNFPISIDVKPNDLSELFTRSGRITINPFKTLVVEHNRIDEGLLQNLRKLGYLKYSEKRVFPAPVEPPPEPEGPTQTVTVEFYEVSSTSDGTKVGTDEVLVSMFTSDLLPLESEVTVDVVRTGGTAIQGVDVNFTNPTTVTFPIGTFNNTQEPVTVNILGSSADASLILGLTNVVGATISGNTSHTITIIGDITP